MKKLLLTCAAFVLAGLNAFADEQPDYVSTGGNIKYIMQNYNFRFNWQNNTKQV